jgi:serine/threonine protein kinase
MFVLEATLAKQLVHKNIARVYEFGRVGLSYFIAMEYVSGQDLRAVFQRARAKDKRIPIEAACYIAAVACDGLQEAHQKVDERGLSLKIVTRTFPRITCSSATRALSKLRISGWRMRAAKAQPLNRPLVAARLHT